MALTKSFEVFQKNGKLLMLALDQRNSFRKMAAKQGLKNEADLIEVKKKIIKNVASQASGILIDQELGLPAIKGLDLDLPFLLSLEKSGYSKIGNERSFEIQLSPYDAVEMGASGVKILVYLNPVAKNFVDQILLIKDQVDLAERANLPLFLEVLIYPEDGKPVKLLETIDLLIQSGVRPSVFKLPYPGSSQACISISTVLSGIPWIVLSSGVNFDLFANQLKDAAANGASGFLAGRSLWQEVFKFKGDKQEAFLSKVFPQRFQQISQIFIKD